MGPEDTRSRLLAYVIDHGEASVAELAGALRLGDAGVRRHLDRLAADDLLRIRSVRQPTGRPYYAYQATEAGVRRQRDHSADLAARIVGEISKREPELPRFVAGIAEQMAAAHRSEVPAGQPLEERVRGTVAALHREGILDAWEATDDGYRLRNCACPYRSAADASDAVCESDRQAIELLIGQPVAQVGSLAHGDRYCEYIVSSEAHGDARPNAYKEREGER